MFINTQNIAYAIHNFTFTLTARYKNVNSLSCTKLVPIIHNLCHKLKSKCQTICLTVTKCTVSTVDHVELRVCNDCGQRPRSPIPT